ncbi:MFS transporter [Thioclava sp. SK-1]|uniref:MFS transporter n=1 Tax=Thioclava sp. SK-1 TaxID=1889770 RepID=UPI00082699BF|nr:MFS transporter [Thioclava sp. SK-1]OCX66088.1 MFS transporter [Thioclava sp. SK-1]
MFTAVKQSWALLLGIMLLMVGNGMQGTLLGIRGEIEGIPTFEMSIVMSAYFAGFLFGSRMVPRMIADVGHVRVFAALGSLISAVLVAYAVAPNWVAWTLMRLLIGFSFCGVYITAESWLNENATNANRGQSLAAYMMVQSLGIIGAQALLNTGDPSGYLLFVIPSILVSISFTPILLSVGKVPNFSTIRRMTFKRLWDVSPLGCVGIFLMGGVFSAMFGMVSIWGVQAGLSIPEISTFITATYVGGIAAQYPIGWLSDRMDRRIMIAVMAAVAAVAMLIVFATDPPFVVLLGAAALIGGIANPLYSLLLAYTNDYLDFDDMAAGSAGLLFINGLGSTAGPVITGWLMGVVGPNGFFLFIAVLTGALAIYAGYRMTQRASGPVAESGAFAVVSPTATAFAVEYALDEASDTPSLSPEDDDQTDGADKDAPTP